MWFVQSQTTRFTPGMTQPKFKNISAHVKVSIPGNKADAVSDIITVRQAFRVGNPKKK